MPAALLNSKVTPPWGFAKIASIVRLSVDLPNPRPCRRFRCGKKVFINDKKATYYSHRREKAAPPIESHGSNEESDKIQTFFLNHKLAVPGTCGG
jgi:hypothetical protein